MKHRANRYIVKRCARNFK